MLVSALSLSACTAEPVTAPATLTPPPSPSATPTTTPTPIAQVFGGDCDEVLTDDEVEELIGVPIELDAGEEARQRLGLEASLVWAGGIVCEWESDRERLQLIVVPRDIVPEGQDPDDADVNGAPCVSASVQCRWIDANDQWWVHGVIYPIAEYQSWEEDPGAAESAVVRAISRSVGWSPPLNRVPEPARLPDCDALLTEVSSLLPDTQLSSWGGEVGAVDYWVVASQLAAGCYWQTSSELVRVWVQPGLGEFDPADLHQANGEEYVLPTGKTAYITAFSPTWATIAAVAGDTRFSISGGGVVSDPDASARVLDAVIDVVTRG